MIFPFSLQVYPLDNYPQGKLETFERNYSHLKRLQIKDIKSIDERNSFDWLMPICTRKLFQTEAVFLHIVYWFIIHLKQFYVTHCDKGTKNFEVKT